MAVIGPINPPVVDTNNSDDANYSRYENYKIFFRILTSYFKEGYLSFSVPKLPKSY